MSYKAQAEEWVRALEMAFEKNPEVARVAIRNLKRKLAKANAPQT